MRRLVLSIALGALVCCAFSPALPSAKAQEVQRIAALVNDDVISGFDVERRLELVLRSTRMTDTPENRRRLRARILEMLIDEKLQLQAAKQQNVQVTDADVKAAISSIEKRNRVPPGHLDDFLRSMGIDRDTLMQQIKARLAWNKVVLRKLSPISDEEVDEALAKAKADVGRPRYRISEIFLPIDSPARADETRQATEDLLNQIKGGVPFADAAREFSRGATAAEGGDIGWVLDDQLDPEVAKALAQLSPGEISDPILSASGYFLIQLHEKDRFRSQQADEAALALRQVLFAVPSSPSRAQIAEAEGRARDFAGGVNGCDDMEAAARRDDGAQFIDLGRLKASQLAQSIRDAVKSLDVGQMSAPLDTPAGVVLLMVCGRDEPQPLPALNRQAVIEDLTQKRMAQASQRYIRDLRRDAVVEYR
jgi:peptidyl-prolyl cis-trans isomerase SurA